MTAEPDHLLVPPAFLIERVSPIALDATDEQIARFFVESGVRSLGELERILAIVDRSLYDFNDVLDWGCGPGRVTLRLLERYPHLNVTGIDTDSGPIEWLTEVAPHATFRRIDPQPPTPLADESFDLVINHSVLTHIDRTSQMLWLAEIARLLRTDGVFVTSVHGVGSLLTNVSHLRDDAGTAEAWRTSWSRHRFVFVDDDHFVGSTHHEGYHSTFQDPMTVETLSDYRLEPLAVLFQGDLGFQDHLVLRKRSPAAVEARRALEMSAMDDSPAEGRTASEHARLDRLERASVMASLALTQLGRQIGRLEESVDRLRRRMGL